MSDKNVPSVLVSPDDGKPVSFVELLWFKGFTVLEFARVVGVSRQCVYNYVKGFVKPSRIPYTTVSDWCQFLGVGDMQLYNAMVESFERNE